MLWRLTIRSFVDGPTVSTAGYVKLLLSPRQSRGNSHWGLAITRITSEFSPPKSMDPLPRKSISTMPEHAHWTPFAFVVDSLLVGAADYAIGHRDRQYPMVLDELLPELKNLFAKLELPAPKEAQYELRDTVRNLLKRSFPNPGDDVKITAMFDKHVDDGSLGIPQARRDGDEIFYTYPVVILAARK